MSDNLPYEIELELRKRDRMLRILMLCYLLLLLGVVTFLQLRRRHAEQAAAAAVVAAAQAHPSAPQAAAAPTPDLTVVAMVNGDPITTFDADQALDEDEGAPMVQRLVTELLILQEARRLQLQLPPDDLVRLQKLQKVLDPNHRAVQYTRLKVRLLLRQMVLQHVSAARRQQVYDEFKPELSRYEVFALRLPSLAEGQRLLARLASGTHLPQAARARIGNMTLQGIEDAFGRPAVDIAYGAWTGKHDGLLTTSGNAVTLLHIGQIQSDYPQVRPELEDVLVAAETPRLLHQLRERAKISYPVHEANGQSLPAAQKEASAQSLSHIFEEPSAAPTGKGPSGVFAPLPSAIKAGSKNPFAEPSAVPLGSRSPGFLMPSAVKGSSTGVFAPLPEGYNRKPRASASPSPGR